MARPTGHDDDEEKPRWRDADDDGEPRDWEVEPEEEREDKHSVLGGTAPLARVIFLFILGFVILGGLAAFIANLGGYFRRGP